MVTKGLNKITQNETQAPQLVDNFCKSWDSELSASKDFKRLSNENDGAVSLTLKQAEKLAKVLRYPFVFLLLDSPVTDIDKLPIADFRSIEGKESPHS